MSRVHIVRRIICFIKCEAFREQSPSQRYDFVKKCKRCVNCLSAKHVSLNDCKSFHVCKRCDKEHHTLLYFDTAEKPNDGTPDSTPSSTQSDTQSEITSHLLYRTL